VRTAARDLRLVKWPNCGKMVRRTGWIFFKCLTHNVYFPPLLCDLVPMCGCSHVSCSVLVCAGRKDTNLALAAEV
jgi:hypothetical protein